MTAIRAFLAVNLPLTIMERVRGLQDELRQQAREAGMKVAWVPPPNMHVTVKFLGQIQAEGAPAIRDRLQRDLEGVPTIQVAVKGVGAFPDPARPRVIWVGAQSADEALEALAQQVDASLEGLGFERESRPFHAHLTLGRVKQGGSVREMLDRLGEVDFGTCSVHEVVLYQSVLQRSGAEYTALGRVPLGAGQLSKSQS